jgi:outer membrane protein OmpA-like peptidoglycan-associated protein
MRSPSISLSWLLALGFGSSAALAQAPAPFPPPTAAPTTAPPPGAAPAPTAPPPGAAPYPGAPAPAPGFAPGAGAPAAGAPAAGAPAPGAAPAGAPAPGAANPYFAPPGGPAPAAGPTAPPPAFGGTASFDTRQGGTFGIETPPPTSEPTQDDRNRSLQEHNSLTGTTGLLRTAEAGSGVAGTFRVHILADWFSSSSFLCFDQHECVLPGVPLADDTATHYGAGVGLSVTPVDFLEAYASIRSESNSNDRGRPELLQVLGDTTFGLKAFTPNHLGQVFNFGGSADLLLLNGAGSVGVDGSATSFRLKAITTLDFRQPNDQGAPLRLHVNVGYLFDNSANLVAGIEDHRRTARDPRGERITRVERFGLGVNRVDQILFNIGAEGMFAGVRPFIEYSLGVAANRQGYICDPSRTPLGDSCLGAGDVGFSSMPSTLTLGLRVQPWLKGFSATAAFDIGTTGTADFIEELAPTAAWDLWLGLGYAFDVEEPVPPKPQVIERTVASAPPERHVRGFVHEKDKQEGIATAIIRYEGRDLTPMATSGDGRFVTTNLEPGAYTFSIHADGYKDGQCNVVVAAASGAAAASGFGGPMAPPPGAPPGAPGMPGAPPGMMPAAAPAPAPGGFVDVDCPLEAVPRTGSVSGRALDAESNSPVTGVSIKIIDTQGKEVGVSAEAGGAFKMEGLQPGTVTIKAEAEGYLPHQMQADVRAREDVKADLMMNKRPAKGDVEITNNELKIKKQIHFETDSAKIMIDSTELLEQIADVLNRNPCLQQLEIQGHTDNTGSKDHNKVLSEQRAGSVREWLLSHGVEPGRLMSKGYGQEKPISPNVTPAGKERNRRVQFMILQKEKGCGKETPAPKKPAGGGGGAGGGAKPKPVMPF